MSYATRKGNKQEWIRTRDADQTAYSKDTHIGFKCAVIGMLVSLVGLAVFFVNNWPK